MQVMCSWEKADVDTSIELDDTFQRLSHILLCFLVCLFATLVKDSRHARSLISAETSFR